MRKRKSLAARLKDVVDRKGDWAKADWGKNDIPATRPESAKDAKAFVQILPAQMHNTAVVRPMWDGEILFDWLKRDPTEPGKGIELEITVKGNGEYCYLLEPEEEYDSRDDDDDGYESRQQDTRYVVIAQNELSTNREFQQLFQLWMGTANNVPWLPENPPITPPISTIPVPGLNIPPIVLEPISMPSEVEVDPPAPEEPE